MADLILHRDFPVPPERLFDAVTQQADLVQWWGHDGMDLPEQALDFSRTGPWFAVMQTDAGQRMKMSGQVTHVDPPHSVGFTWAWHDEADRRGAESHVSFEISAHGPGARLTLKHVDLPDDEAAERHNRGWSSTLKRLTAHLD